MPTKKKTEEILTEEQQAEVKNDNTEQAEKPKRTRKKTSESEPAEIQPDNEEKIGGEEISAKESPVTDGLHTERLRMSLSCK